MAGVQVLRTKQNTYHTYTLSKTLPQRRYRDRERLLVQSRARNFFGRLIFFQFRPILQGVWVEKFKTDSAVSSQANQAALSRTASHMNKPSWSDRRNRLFYTYIRPTPRVARSQLASVRAPFLYTSQKNTHHLCLRELLLVDSGDGASSRFWGARRRWRGRRLCIHQRHGGSPLV